jgi:DNA (cytosine-5)-methyltransferase 1
MTPKDFFDKVVEMRRCQKEYFKNKKQTGKRGFFNQQYLYENKVSYTLTTHADSIIPFKQPIYLSRSEVCNISTFPQDYHFLNQSPHYICGMSVPPVMMAHVASRIWKYWLSKL